MLHFFRTGIILTAAIWAIPAFAQADDAPWWTSPAGQQVAQQVEADIADAYPFPAGLFVVAVGAPVNANIAAVNVYISGDQGDLAIWQATPLTARRDYVDGVLTSLAQTFPGSERLFVAVRDPANPRRVLAAGTLTADGNRTYVGLNN